MDWPILFNISGIEQEHSVNKSVENILPLEIDSAGILIGGREVLGNISMKIQAGRPSVVVGPNAAGKTMLLCLCHGLRKPTYGSVRWLGKNADRPLEHQAMVLQRPVLLRRSVQENIDFALKCRGFVRSKRNVLVRETLKATGLEALASARARRLSAGQQQRVALARAWAVRPEVLFLDEPISGLDPPSIQALETAIFRISEGGTKIIMTTHNLAQAKRVAGEILFVHEGQLLEQTNANEFFTSPRSSQARDFLKNHLSW